tara:strand:+ start:4193 stop:4828 length:636 start_codon:yes stop_codon:yes gene_type:complete
MSTLVYVGANMGGSLWNMVGKYDSVHVFEPDPEIFYHLKEIYGSYKWVNLVNAACSENKGKAKFFITPNRVSSSLSIVSTSTHEEDHPQRDYREIEVNTINLLEYLKEHNVEYIDYYMSDAQGSDLTILKTIKPYIDNKKIGKMFIETHGDGLYIYDNLNNQFEGFKELLSANYKFEYASLGRLGDKLVSESNIPEGEYEWDSLWTVKVDK